MPDRRVNGVRLYYEEHGEGQPILVIHGTSSSALIWGAAVAELASLGRVIVYDRRGCTRSERPDPYETRVSDHADDAAALLEALSATPAVVIGRSYGGVIGIDLALRYPERVLALVLLEAALLSLVPEVMASAERFRERVLAAAEADVGSVGEMFIRSVLGDDAWDALPDQLREMYIDNGPAIVAEFKGGTLEVDRDTLSTLAKPTLLVAAAHSPPAYRQVSDALADAIPGARRVLVGGGHSISPSEPAVLDFLREIAA